MWKRIEDEMPETGALIIVSEIEVKKRVYTVGHIVVDRDGDKWLENERRSIYLEGKRDRFIWHPLSEPSI